MGEEKRPALAQPQFRQRNLHWIDGNPRQVAQPRDWNVEGEKRGDRRHQRVAQRDRQLSRRRGPATAGGEHQTFGFDHFPAAQPEREAAAGPPFRAFQAAIGPQFHFGGARRAREAVNNGL